VNAVLGAIVVAVGAWLASNAVSIYGAGAVLVGAAAFLSWRGRTAARIWAWTTLLLGVECFSWPIMTILQIRAAGGDPSDEEMGAILSATLMGLFSAVFWIAFSYGLFKRSTGGEPPREPAPAPRNKR
jgi:hypothetical protein